MLTTKRIQNYSNLETESVRGGVDLLERNSNYSAHNSTYVNDENISEVRDRMQKNLDKILNYDKFQGEEVASVSVDSKEKVDEVVASTVALDVQEDDITPTSTTMQFGDANIDQIYNDMNRSQKKEAGYHLNAKGRLVVVLYALVVTVILALIALNTGVLADMKSAKVEQLNTIEQLQNSFNAQIEQLENISSKDYVIDKAINDLGMTWAN